VFSVPGIMFFMPPEGLFEIGSEHLLCHAGPDFHHF
jgi:hypothetical protein